MKKSHIPFKTGSLAGKTHEQILKEAAKADSKSKKLKDPFTEGAPAMNGPGSLRFTAGVTPMIVTAAPFSFSNLEEFFRGGPGPSRETLFMTFVLSLAFYGVSAFVLLHACLSRFETEAGRPRRGFSDDPDRVSREGIVFEEQEPDKLDQDGILFVEQAGDEESRQQGPQDDGSHGPHSDLTH